MSTRSDIRSAIITAVEGLVASSVTVDTWSGDEAAFNAANTWPAVYLAYYGMTAGEDEELGSVASYEVSYDFMLFVCTKTTSSAGAGDVQAMTILEAIEEGMMGSEVASTGQAALHPAFDGGRCEALIEVRLGQYLYGQAWRIAGFASH